MTHYILIPLKIGESGGLGYSLVTTSRDNKRYPKWVKHMEPHHKKTNDTPKWFDPCKIIKETGSGAQIQKNKRL